MNTFINNLIEQMHQNPEVILRTALIFCGIGGVGLVIAMIWISVTGNWGRVAVPLAVSLLMLAGVAAGVAFLLENFNILLIGGLVVMLVFIFLLWRIYGFFSTRMEDERYFRERFEDILELDDTVRMISELTMLSKSPEVEENPRRHEIVLKALKRVKRQERMF